MAKRKIVIHRNIYLYCIFLFVFITLNGCNDPTANETAKANHAENLATPQKKQDESLKDTLVKEVAPVIHKEYEYFFVSAKSGINFYNAPKQDSLGLFPLNTQIQVIEHTGIFNEETQDEWLAIEYFEDTVYILNNFLSTTFISSDITLYNALPFYKSEKETRQAFVNISESYRWNFDSDSLTIIPEEQFGQDTIHFNQKLKKQLLTNVGISKEDTIFIYNIYYDVVYKFAVKSTLTMATVNIYSQGDELYGEYEYELGFNLKRKYTLEGEAFAYIGKSNPFQTGKLEPIIWEGISAEDFPKKFNTDIILDDRRRWLDGFVAGKSYKSSVDGLDIYIQDLIKEKRSTNRFMVVLDSNTKEIVYEAFQISSESTYIVPIGNDKYSKQWIGKLFKDKPPVIFGFKSASFGCAGFEFLDKTEPFIPFLCDNRH